jgi:DNA-binding CsgD family transcriptional regulator
MSYENGAPMILSFDSGPFHRLDPPTQRILTTTPDGSELHGRLCDVLGCMLDGVSEKEVAMALHISRHTVHAHVRKLYERYGVCSHLQLMAEAYATALTTLRSGTRSDISSIAFIGDRLDRRIDAR